MSETATPTLNAEEEAFLQRGRALFTANTDWLEFESFAFGMGSPIFSAARSHHGPPAENPLYVELRGMWLQLGVRQGKVRDGEPISEPLPH